MTFFWKKLLAICSELGLIGGIISLIGYIFLKEKF